MTRDAYVLLNLRTTFHPNLLFNHTDYFRLTFELRVALVRIKPLAIDVLHVGDQMRDAPGDVTIASGDDERKSRNRRADHVDIAGAEMRKIPERWNTRTKMRIVGEDRRARGAFWARDYPRVRSQTAVVNSADAVGKLADVVSRSHQPFITRVRRVCDGDRVRRRVFGQQLLRAFGPDLINEVRVQQL